MRELVIGAGQVGNALGLVLECDVRDLANHPGTYDRLHIAFPYGPDFVAEVKYYQNEHQASQVVVHSTVAPGTCDPQGWTHSPVRGRHPDLVTALKTFTKFFGGPGEPAFDWQHKVGHVATTPRAVTTELAKVWELAAFGVNVAVEKAVWDACEEWGADWDVAYRQFALTHNQGVRQMGYGSVAKPILKHMPGPIGGHCVVSNMHLIDHPIARIVEET